jgi:hypothetical protein
LWNDAATERLLNDLGGCSAAEQSKKQHAAQNPTHREPPFSHASPKMIQAPIGCGDKPELAEA